MDAGDNLESMRRDLPEEFWDDFDQIRTLLNASVSALIERVASVVGKLEELSDKEVGLRLDTIDASVRPFIFQYRKTGPDLMAGRSR